MLPGHQSQGASNKNSTIRIAYCLLLGNPQNSCYMGIPAYGNALIWQFSTRDFLPVSLRNRESFAPVLIHKITGRFPPSLPENRGSLSALSTRKSQRAFCRRHPKIAVRSKLSLPENRGLLSVPATSKLTVVSSRVFSSHSPLSDKGGVKK